MEQKQITRQYCQQFNLSGINKSLDDIIVEAEHKTLGYLDYTMLLLSNEAEHRQMRDIKKRMRFASLPPQHDLRNFDPGFCNGITISKIYQLKELHWMD